MKNNNFTLQLNLESFTDEIAQKVIEKLSLDGLGQSTQQNKEEYLTTQQAKEFLSVKSSKTLSDYVKKGYIPEPSQVGGRTKRYKKSDLQKFLNDGI